MVFQNYALYQHMSVYDNLAFGLRNRRVSEPEIDVAIKHAARILSIEPLLARRPKQLSGGQQQRVALGRCIVRNPKVFLFDEPLSNLDAQLRAQMRIEIKELRERVPTTSVFVTHDQVEAMTLGDRIVVMKDGLVQQVGTPLELYRRPTNRFVASFIGSPMMNFIDLALDGEGDSFRLSAEGHSFLLQARRFPALGAHVGSGVVAGIRPQNLRLGIPSGDNQIGFSWSQSSSVTNRFSSSEWVTPTSASPVSIPNWRSCLMHGSRCQLNLPTCICSTAAPEMC